ncbi:uncharacterized protein LAESUDRAFT_622408, partial [Laetiporus sulphureus 93-53]
KHFNQPFDHVNPLLLLSAFTALVLSLFRHVTHRSCNFALRMLKLIVGTALQQSDKRTMQEEGLLKNKNFPTDIRTIRKLFDLDPVVTVLATCPSCSSTYEPTYNAGVPIYP